MQWFSKNYSFSILWSLWARFQFPKLQRLHFLYISILCFQIHFLKLSFSLSSFINFVCWQYICSHMLTIKVIFGRSLLWDGVAKLCTYGFNLVKRFLLGLLKLVFNLFRMFLYIIGICTACWNLHLPYPFLIILFFLLLTWYYAPFLFSDKLWFNCSVWF